MPITLAGGGIERVVLYEGDFVGDAGITIPNPGWVRLVFWMNVTANPGAGETILLNMFTRIPTAGGTLVQLGGTAASALGGVAGSLSLSLGPGVTVAWNSTASAVREMALPKNLVPQFVMSAAGTWTLTAGVDGWYI